MEVRVLVETCLELYIPFFLSIERKKVRNFSSYLRQQVDLERILDSCRSRTIQGIERLRIRPTV